MAVEFDGGVVMGADSRTTTGNSKAQCIGFIFELFQGHTLQTEFLIKLPLYTTKFTVAAVVLHRILKQLRIMFVIILNFTGNSPPFIII
jgi:hypothetical protein